MIVDMIRCFKTHAIFYPLEIFSSRLHHLDVFQFCIKKGSANYTDPSIDDSAVPILKYLYCNC